LSSLFYCCGVGKRIGQRSIFAYSYSLLLYTVDIYTKNNCFRSQENTMPLSRAFVYNWSMTFVILTLAISTVSWRIQCPWMRPLLELLFWLQGVVLDILQVCLPVFIVVVYTSCECHILVCDFGGTSSRYRIRMECFGMLMLSMEELRLERDPKSLTRVRCSGGQMCLTMTVAYGMYRL
jgi:hypothetical protein